MLFDWYIRNERSRIIQTISRTNLSILFCTAIGNDAEQVPFECPYRAQYFVGSCHLRVIASKSTLFISEKLLVIKSVVSLVPLILHYALHYTLLLRVIHQGIHVQIRKEEFDFLHGRVHAVRAVKAVLRVRECKLRAQ